MEEKEQLIKAVFEQYDGTWIYFWSPCKEAREVEWSNEKVNMVSRVLTSIKDVRKLGDNQLIKYKTKFEDIVSTPLDFESVTGVSLIIMSRNIHKLGISRIWRDY